MAKSGYEWKFPLFDTKSRHGRLAAKANLGVLAYMGDQLSIAVLKLSPFYLPVYIAGKSNNDRFQVRHHDPSHQRNAGSHVFGPGG